jgi:hypothetical protein
MVSLKRLGLVQGTCRVTLKGFACLQRTLGALYRPPLRGTPPPPFPQFPTSPPVISLELYISEVLTLVSHNNTLDIILGYHYYTSTIPQSPFNLTEIGPKNLLQF